VKKSLIGYLRVNKEKISVIYNGIDTTRFIPTNKRIGKKINIIYVGRLVKEKGVQNILEALKYLDDLPEYSLKIVGGGTYQETLETLTTKLELCEQVEFCGYRENIPELLQQADIFVHMPEWEEGFGISVVEAMASGKVCIVADCGAMPEIISDGIDGFLVPKGNVIALSETIRNVAEQINSAEMEQIRTNAVNKAKLFTIKNFANNLDAVIET
jgi:glycosyltransferase involved in cell wall biosynthesis